MTKYFEGMASDTGGGTQDKTKEEILKEILKSKSSLTDKEFEDVFHAMTTLVGYKSTFEAMEAYAQQERVKAAGEAWDHAVEWRDLERTAAVEFGYRKNHVSDKEAYLSNLKSTEK